MIENLIKKKEEILRYEEWKISDQLRNLSEENTKINYIFVISGILLTALFDSGKCSLQIGLIILFAFLVGIYNFLSKKVAYHNNEDNRFYDDKMSYENYLKEKFKSQRKSRKEIDLILNEKIELNKLSFMLLALSFIFLIITL